MIEAVEHDIEEDVDFINIRRRVQNAVDSAPTNVTFEQALAQVNKKHANIVETNIGGHILSRVGCNLCEVCGEEKTNIMIFGEVCVHCDSANN